jgi:sec-independent protein translocase protein TatA
MWESRTYSSLLSYSGETTMIPGPSELILILLIVVVVFGAKRIPEIMGGLGKGIRTFKKAMEEDEPLSTPPTEATPQAVPPAQTSATPVEPSNQNRFMLNLGEGEP